MRTSIMKPPPEFAKEIPATVAAMSRAHYGLLEANMGLAGLSPADVGYSDRVRVIDAAVLLLSRAKWLYGRATGELADFGGRTESAADLVAAASLFAEVEAMAAVSKAPDSQALRQSADIHAAVSHNGTEIQYFQDVPIVPSICPVVVLVGNSREMGAQYVRQCVQIFGPFVFSAVARRELNAADLDVLGKWREMMSRYTPEILEMAEGMSIAAAELGIAVSTDQALSMWTDITAPSTALAPIGVLDAVGGGRMNAYFGADGSTPVEAEDLCSGCAAWGSASADGQLHYAASTDHDCTFQATIIAFPDTGLPFIYTPFSVNGSIPGTGRFGFAGHPGQNLAGLAYVHHGGGGSCGEPPESWGFGVPRGAVTMHVLRYAQNVHEARTMILNMPTGNVGRLLGTTGGFYADASGGFVLEETLPQLVTREKQFDANGGTHSVLYATNNVQSSELGEYGRRWGMEYNVEAGWHTLDGSLLATGSPGEMTRRQWSASSESRNRFFYRHLVVQEKKWTADSLRALFSIPPQFGNELWRATETRLVQGQKLAGSPAHRLNAFVSSGSPSSGLYTGCVGSLAHRSLTPNRPGHGYFYVDETSTSWSLQLTGSPAATIDAARKCACRLLLQAERAMQDKAANLPECSLVHGWLEQAREAFELSSAHEICGADETARQLRALTRAQVRSRQILDALAIATHEPLNNAT